MKLRDWIIVAFVLALLMSASALWLAEVQVKREAAEMSIKGIKAALTPYERDRRQAIEKARLAGVEKYVEGER